MSKFFSRLTGFFTSRNLTGVDKAGNRYFTLQENVDGIMKEKRWVKFKAEDDPTSIPVEWICWLNGQRKKAPTDQEMAELEARRERVKLNIAVLKKEEEERKSKEGKIKRSVSTDKVGGPDLKSFIRQFPTSSVEGDRKKQQTNAADDNTDSSRSTEPTGTGKSYKPGTWQPPT
ncbi:hypothetical protein MKX01_012077 [Papaver californicum]|nr:hypothetical protein MKX01_012077 [Papaver californicum]